MIQTLQEEHGQGTRWGFLGYCCFEPQVSVNPIILTGNCTSAEALSLYQERTLADSSFKHDWICFIKNTDICKSCFMHTHTLLSTFTRFKTRLGISLKLPEQLATKKKAASWLLWAFSDTVFVQFSPLFGPPISVAPLNTTAFTMFCCRTRWTEADRISGEPLLH